MESLSRERNPHPTPPEMLYPPSRWAHVVLSVIQPLASCITRLAGCLVSQPASSSETAEPTRELCRLHKRSRASQIAERKI